MRKQALRRTTLRSLIGLKSTASAQEPSPWNFTSSLDTSSTTALIEPHVPNLPVDSPSTSTETLATPLPGASDTTLISETTSTSSVASTEAGTTLAPSDRFPFTVALPTPSEAPKTMSLPIVQNTTAVASGAGSSSQVNATSATTRTAAFSRTMVASTTTSSTPLASPALAPRQYVKMGMMGVLGAAAGLFMI